MNKYLCQFGVLRKQSKHPEDGIDGVETRPSCSYEVISLLKVCINCW